MGKEENTVQKSALEYGEVEPSCTWFRNNTGALRVGRRFVKFGLCKGSSDIIGYTSVKITPAMVGKNVAVFTAIEIKKPGEKKATVEQEDFVLNVREAGGIGFVADTLDIIINEIKKWKTKMKRR